MSVYFADWGQRFNKEKSFLFHIWLYIGGFMWSLHYYDETENKALRNGSCFWRNWWRLVGKLCKACKLIANLALIKEQKMFCTCSAHISVQFWTPGCNQNSPWSVRELWSVLPSTCLSNYLSSSFLEIGSLVFLKLCMVLGTHMEICVIEPGFLEKSPSSKNYQKCSEIAKSIL